MDKITYTLFIVFTVLEVLGFIHLRLIIPSIIKESKEEEDLLYKVSLFWKVVVVLLILIFMVAVSWIYPIGRAIIEGRDARDIETQNKKV
jgi:hypothetical protein